MGIKLTITDIASATGGVVVDGKAASALVAGFSTDSRNIKAGQFFFALRGKNHDGHAYIEDVKSKGAIGAVVDDAFVYAVGAEKREEIEKGGFTLVAVKDTLAALGLMGGYVRNLSGAKVAAITGSAGKTTTKEMLASILSRSKTVLKTEGNLNNLIGVPLTLFSLNGVHDAAVIEMGISVPGEMKQLSRICSADVAVITNVGRSHLEGLGSAENVAKEKLELFANLKKGGVRVVNCDDKNIREYSEKSKNGVTDITFGFSEGVDVRILDAQVADSGLKATYSVRGEKVEVMFKTPLSANAVNGACAMAAALAYGIGIKEMKEGLEAAIAPKGRLAVMNAGGITLIDDTYNANPESLRAAIATLKSFKGRRVAILGDMLELGAASEALHEEGGMECVKNGVEALIASGRFAASYARGAAEGGMNEKNIFTFKDNATAAKELKKILRQGDAVLVKGSRSSRMEELVEAVKNIFGREGK